MQRFTVDISDELAKTLDDLSKRNNIKKAEVMRRAFSLLSIASNEKQKGNTLAIVRECDNNQEPKVVARLVGID